MTSRTQADASVKSSGVTEWRIRSGVCNSACSIAASQLKPIQTRRESKVLLPRWFICLQGIIALSLPGQFLGGSLARVCFVVNDVVLQQHEYNNCDIGSSCYCTFMMTDKLCTELRSLAS